MSIRIRTVNGTRVALCAAETDAQPGDVYLDDADQRWKNAAREVSAAAGGRPPIFPGRA